jgi:hypothetical protein
MRPERFPPIAFLFLLLLLIALFLLFADREGGMGKEKARHYPEDGGAVLIGAPLISRPERGAHGSSSPAPRTPAHIPS